MPWTERDRMSLRTEFVLLDRKSGLSFAELCRRFGISRKTGYKWRDRFNEDGVSGLADRSRRPDRSPHQTSRVMEEAVLRVRQRHPTWGGRKIRAVLLRQGYLPVPSASTITAILHRHGKIDPAESIKRVPMQRFERPHPNDLWQMDFKGDFGLGCGGRCHPLTVLDDHSRYSIGLRACGNQRYGTVRDELFQLFRLHGLPRMMLMDNGTPWGVAHSPGVCFTRLTAWLLRLDVQVIHGRPYHPQTQGKEERFHRTLKEELLRDRWYGTRAEAQRDFDPWRRMYNYERPHEALDMAVPADRYRPSERAMPAKTPPLLYGPGVEVRSVNPSGQVRFQGKTMKVSEAFAGNRIGLRPTETDGVYCILWGRYPVGEADMRGRGRKQKAVVRLRSLRSLRQTTAIPDKESTL